MLTGDPAREPEEPNEGRHRADFAGASMFGEAPGPAGRPSREALAREHEAARMRAKLMDPETAVRELAERLTFAHVNAGKPSLAVLSEAVHYSKGTLSKVFAGKMMPSWPLVEDLAVELRVPTQTVVREWFHLWTAANTLRRKPVVEQERVAVQQAPTATVSPCPECGSWTADPALHSGWHRRIGEAGRGGPTTGTAGGWHVQARAFSLNREVLGADGR
jgi:hypothetical protein